MGSLHDVDGVVAAVLADPDLVSPLHDARGYASFIRKCISPLSFSVTPIKLDASDRSPSRLRFTTLLNVLANGVPPVPIATAVELAALADRLTASRHPVEYEAWAGDVGLHFTISSPFGEKGGLLRTAARLMRS